MSRARPWSSTRRVEPPRRIEQRSFRRDGSALHSIVRVMTRQVLAQEVEADIMTMAGVDPELHRPVINSRNSWSFSTDGGRQSPFRVNAFELTSAAEDSNCVVVDLDSRRGHAPAANDLDHGEIGRAHV